MSEEEKTQTEDAENTESSIASETYAELAKTCDNIESAIFLGMDPSTKELLVWYKGNQLEAAKMAAFFTRTIKFKIIEDLKT